MRFRDRVEAEFGEPFADVLQGFADMGYGCDTTAKLLEYCPSSFRRLLKRNGIAIRWPTSDRRISTRPPGPTPGTPKMIAARRAMAPVHTHPVTGEQAIAAEWARRLGISTKQFQRRYDRYGESRLLFLPKQSPGLPLTAAILENTHARRPDNRVPV